MITNYIGLYLTYLLSNMKLVKCLTRKQASLAAGLKKCHYIKDVLLCHNITMQQSKCERSLSVSIQPKAIPVLLILLSQVNAKYIDFGIWQ